MVWIRTDIPDDRRRTILLLLRQLSHAPPPVFKIVFKFLSGDYYLLLILADFLRTYEVLCWNLDPQHGLQEAEEEPCL
ncbi:hypothetical protein GJ744_003867 [Endocarpon pusillum]|uniref:Uncharacterized protein n=1 Tax=Endocarpon pusillum TaxID=364733 RepID=A0A8H7E5Y9_9EURO|nr:hypothetical protein GJ744_003867 [Endocarpon pusillum]